MVVSRNFVLTFLFALECGMALEGTRGIFAPPPPTARNVARRT